MTEPVQPALGDIDPIEEAGAGTPSRRKFMAMALATAGAGSLLAACTDDDSEQFGSEEGDGEGGTGDSDLDEALQASDLPTIEWDLATSWPLALDTIYGGATFFAEQVALMTGGRFTINAAPGGDLVPALEILQSVQNGAVNAGHTASYYYIGLDEITAFGTAIPFGFTARQQNAWLYEGGGLEMLQEIYRERFGVIQFPAGNTGCQMGGWFNKEINSVADLGGLRMRIPGLGGRVMERLGVSVQVIPGGEIYQSLETGAIDAAEWVGPYDDVVQEFNQVTQFYYYPGWWEPGPSLEVQFPVSEYDALPEEYKAVLANAASFANHQMLAKYDALNPPALQQIIESDVEILPYPDDVMEAAESETLSLLDEIANDDDDYRSVLDNWLAFREGIGPWHGLAEKAMLDFLGA